MMDTMAAPQSGYHHSNPPPTVSPDPPIDPTLAIDPAILGHSSSNQPPALSQYFSRPPSPTSAPKFQFEQGPQGDPFAPQQDESFFQPHPPSPPRPLKRKRRTRPAARRDDDCSFCQGDDSQNKNGRPEEMVSCVTCGRSGHPSCLGIEGIAEVLRSYPWHCIECKICEVCDKKGNGNRMLFCDACDRGWHMDCLDPPLESTPDGSWICPHCPAIPSQPPGIEDIRPSSPPLRTSPSPVPSVASSSRLLQQPDSKSRSRKGKRKTHEDSEGNEEEPPRVRHKTEAEARIGTKGRGKAKGKGKGKAPTDVKGKGRARMSQTPDDPSPSIKVLPRLRVSMRGRSRSPANPPAHAPRKVRLVVRKPKVVYDENDDDNDQDDGSPRHMFEGVLKPEEYSTTNTTVHDADKSLFNRSRTRAEMKLGPPVAPPPLPSALLTPGPSTPVPSTPTAGPSSSLLHSLRTRHSLAQALHSHIALDTTPATPHTPSQIQADGSLPPRIRTIRFGEYDVDTWYDAPFPEEYASVADGKLWMCEFCLKYMKSRFQSTRHRMKCKARHPPGDEIYRDGAISVFEVDGRKNKIYCQNLCLLSKMFLDHKSLFYDVEPFLFYVMTEVDRLGARFVGYFSKEKRSPKDYNVSCIMTLPVRQRRGWGNILIDFSYLLSKKENRVGSPERPLSALGALAYKQYWTHTVKLFLHTASEAVTLEGKHDISRATSMTLEDIYNTLREQDFITAKEVSPPPPPRPPPGTPIKYLRGRKNGPGVTRRGLTRTNTKDDTKAPLVIPTEYTIHWDHKELDAYVAAWQAKGHVTIQQRCLKWSPFLLARARKSETVGGTSAGGLGGDTGGTALTELDRSSASSTKVTQGAPLDVAVSTPKQQMEPSPSVSAHMAETQSPTLTVDLEESKPSAPRSMSRDASQVAEDRALATELARASDSPRRLRNTRSKSLRDASADRPRSSPLVSANVPQRTLRSRVPVNVVRRTRNTEDDKTDGTADEMDLLQDSAAKLARQERPSRTSRTRSVSYKTDPPKAPTPRTSPRKRRRVESSEPEPELELESEPEPDLDVDGSLSELTRTSASPSPSTSPPLRHTKRAVNGQFQSKARNDTPHENGTSSHNSSARSTRSEAQPLASGVRSSSRINGAVHIPLPARSALKKPVVVEEVPDGRTRSTRRAKAESVHEDAHAELTVPDKKLPKQTVSGHQREEEDEEVEARKSAAAGFPTSMNGAAPSVNGTGLDSGTPGLYDEDALGEEDAEGEEDDGGDED